MIRNLIVIAVASFVLTIVCAAGVVALGGRDLLEHGWSIPGDIQVSDNGDDVHISVGGREALGPETTRDVAWAGGPSLQINLPAEVTYIQGAATKVTVTVTGPRALVDRVSLVDGSLRLDPVGGDTRVTLRNGGLGIDTVRHGLKITIVAPAVTRFVLNGSPSLSLAAYDQPELAVEINGSGEVTGSGKTDALSVTIAGSGDASLPGLQANNANVSISGSGDAEVAARGAVQVAIAGSGDVTLTTKPASLSSNIDGSGDLHLPE